MGKVRIKRKHTEDHPAIFATKRGYVRNEILSFIHSKGGVCDFSEYESFCKSIHAKHKMSYIPSKWHLSNKKYVKQTHKDGKNFLKLTRLGSNLVKLVLNG